MNSVCKWIGIVVIMNFCNVFAEVKPAGVFTDHAVLQQGEPVRVWGTAAPGEKVTVSFAGQSREAVAAEDGTWMV
ncbi:MAG: sialate O-acetylesterase, partial [Kiritimatiellales bacterium]